VKRQPLLVVKALSREVGTGWPQKARQT